MGVPLPYSWSPLSMDWKGRVAGGVKVQGRKGVCWQLCGYETFPDNLETIWKKYIKSNGVGYVSKIPRKIHCYWEGISGRIELHNMIPKFSFPDVAIVRSPASS